jgi:TolA-binding protein
MKVSEHTNVQMPLKTVVSLITLVAVGTWAYFGVVQRITELETSKQLMSADLLKAADQKPIDMEQTMLVEWLAKNQEGIQKEMESMMNNRVNIDFLKDQVTKLQGDVEKLKDKVRQNGNTDGSN